jgi:polyisoprenoid-binding protein YceI
MKSLTLLLSTIFILSSFTATHVDKYDVDTEKSKLTWKAEKISGGHDGFVFLKSGNIMMDHGKISAANFVVDMNTITNEDIESEEYSQKLVGHLKSADFFEVDKFPEVTFSMIKSNPNGNDKFDIVGELTIKGNKDVISFPIEISQTKSELIAKGTFTFDRTKFDIIYGSGSFFDNLGDKAIKHEVNVDFEIVFNK